jgi:hypothetical protein
MAGVVGEILYEVALRALDDQEREVAGLRSRGSTLLATATVVATLLANAAFGHARAGRPLALTATVVGMFGVAAVLGSVVFLLRSHTMRFSLDAEDLGPPPGDGPTPMGWDAETLREDLAVVMTRFYRRNAPRIDALRIALSVALTSLVVEVLGLGLAAAVA